MDFTPRRDHHARVLGVKTATRKTISSSPSTPAPASARPAPMSIAPQRVAKSTGPLRSAIVRMEFRQNPVAMSAAKSAMDTMRTDFRDTREREWRRSEPRRGIPFLAARKRLSGSEGSEDSDETESHVDDHEPTGLKAARKYAPNIGRKSARMPKLAARKHEVIEISSDEEPPSSDSDDEYHDVRTAFQSITILTHLSKRTYNSSPRAVPFLLRNLRKGFLSACERDGIRTHPHSAPRLPVRIILKYPIRATSLQSEYASDDDDMEEHDGGYLSEWRCPLCDLHGELSTREMLVYHMSRDHDDVTAKWLDEGSQWQMIITLKQQRATSRHDLQMQELQENFTDVLALAEESVSIKVPRSPSPLAPALSVIHHKFERSEEDDVPLRLRFDDTDKEPTSADTSSDPRCCGMLDGKLLPPPKDNMLGPAAYFPYGAVSCRPGGPYLYDLLNELPMEEFGVLAWSIIDREEEIFELEDVLDEDKVMLALWNRWIALHRVDFIFSGYLKSVKGFIDKYYQMIHRAAGYHAFRMHLLILSGNRFLTFTDVANALRYYEDKVGMKTWYGDEDSTQ